MMNQLLDLRSLSALEGERPVRRPDSLTARCVLVAAALDVLKHVPCQDASDEEVARVRDAMACSHQSAGWRGRTERGSEPAMTWLVSARAWRGIARQRARARASRTDGTIGCSACRSWTLALLAGDYGRPHADGRCGSCGAPSAEVYDAVSDDCLG